MRYFKVYGLQRSGTNLFKYLMEHNFNVHIHQNAGGWKHALYKGNGPKGEASFYIVKPLLAWIASYTKYKKYNPAKATNQQLIALAKHYRAYNANWQRKCYRVNYEDLLLRPDQVLNHIAADFHLNRVGTISTVNTEMPKEGESHSNQWPKGAQFNRKYYTEKQYLKEFSKKQRELIKTWQTGQKA